MWYYEIVGNFGECLEGGAFKDKMELRRYCERRMKQLNADNWFAEWIPDGEEAPIE